MQNNIQLPPLLDIPPKLIPIVTKIDEFKYFLLEGGRGSGKTQSVAREILCFGEQVKIRVVCGREIQASIEESVYTVFKDIILDYNLNWKVYSRKIVNKKTGTEIKFRGFREQGSVNIKGLEGVDILWIDEGQAISENTLQTIIPTMREEKVKVFFTMNRYLKDDPVYVFLAGRPDCLHIHIDFFENQHCPETLKIEAQRCKDKNLEEYAHIWLGQPLSQANTAAFRNVEGIIGEYENGIPPDPRFHYVMGADYAKSVDYTFFTILNVEMKRFDYIERLENENRASWYYQKQKTLALSSKYNNALIVPDSTGVGDPIVEDLQRKGGNVYYEETESGKTTSGVKFTGISKENLIEKLKVAMEVQAFQIPYAEYRANPRTFSEILYKELKIFEATKLVSGKIRYAAPTGKDEQGLDLYHDDGVISLALAIWGARDFLYVDEYKDPEPMTEGRSFWRRVRQDVINKNKKDLTISGIERNIIEENTFRNLNED